MKRRDCLQMSAAVCASGGALALHAPAIAQCAAAGGLGQGFHLGEVFGRTIADYRAMAAGSATLARFGIRLDADAMGSHFGMPAQAEQELMRQVDFAAATGLRLVVVLRPPPEPDASLWERTELQDSLESIWRALARRLAGRKEIAAFDLVNEPHPPGASFALKQARWQRLALRLARAIRTEDPGRVLVVEPSPGARPLGFETCIPLPLSNVVYSVHMYEPFELTHQRVGDPKLTGVIDYPGPVTPGGEVWNAQRLREVLMPVKQFADRHGVEIFVGEFGIPRWAPGASRERYLTDLIVIFAEWRWSWTYHAWREWHGWDAEMGATSDDHRRQDSRPAFDVLRAAMRRCRVSDVPAR